MRRFLLGDQLADRNDFDAEIAAIGLGVTRSFERFCNRLFERTENGTDILSANRSHWHLRRYPVESISTVEQKDGDDTGWVALTGAIINSNPSTGWIDFGAAMGPHNSLVRVTYTGGYWWDQSDQGTASQPAGSTKVPDDLVLAWQLQSQHLWGRRDKLGAGLVTGQEVVQRLGDADLVPEVANILGGYVRYQMS